MRKKEDAMEYAVGLLGMDKRGGIALRKLTMEISEANIEERTERGWIIMGVGTTISDDESGGEPFSFILATRLETCPTSIESSSRPGYMLFHYDRDAVFVYAPTREENRKSVHFVSDITNIEVMMNLNLSGKTAVNVPYSQQYDIMRKNQELNTKLDVPARTDEFYVSALFVGKDNKPYRLSKECQEGNDFDYRAIKVEEAGRVSNAFNALTGRNIELGMLTSLTLDHKKELPTVLEKPSKL